MNLERITKNLLEKMSDETTNMIGPNKEVDDGCSLQICEHIHNGYGKLKIEDLTCWFSGTPITRVILSENLISCIPLQVMAKWNVNYLLAAYYMRYISCKKYGWIQVEDLHTVICRRMMRQLKENLQKPSQPQVRALLRWGLIDENGALTKHVTEGLLNVIMAGFRLEFCAEALDWWQSIFQYMHHHMESLKFLIKTDTLRYSNKIVEINRFING
jgi:hypothetical protein